MLVSETLNRSHLSHFESEFTQDSLIHHAHFVSNLPISETRLKQFQLETKNDPVTLQTLIAYTTHVWPEKHLIPTDLLPYYTHRSAITFGDGILLKNEQNIVPTTLQDT